MKNRWQNSRLSIYIHFSINSFLRFIEYKENLLLLILSHVISLFIQISIWKALFSVTDNFEINPNNYLRLKDIITYVALSNGLSLIINNNVVGLINQKIRTGNIITDLIKPINFKYYIFADFVGGIIARITFQLVPYIILILAFDLIHISDSTNWFLFISCLFFSLIINFYFRYILGLLAFFFIETWPLNFIFDSFFVILSGAWIPIWFFPNFLYYLSNILPFKYVYYIPISMALHKIPESQITSIFLGQAIWIFILFCAERLIWKESSKKLLIQGG